MSESASWMHIGLHGHSVGTFIAEKSGIRWKSALNTDDDDIVLSRFIPHKSITAGQWTVFGRSGHLRIHAIKEQTENNIAEFRFDGFPPSDFEQLRSALSALYAIEVAKLPMACSGSSFGLTNISTNGHLVFRECILDEVEEGEEFEPRDGDEVLSTNLTEVGQCVMQGKTRNEIELQFHESDTVEAGTDQLVSIRFYVPPDPDGDIADKDTPTPAEIFHQRILTVANIKNTAGNEIVQFSENQGTFLTPRGRYKITLFDSHLRMHGNRYDYKIKYDDISRLFLLPRPGGRHKAFVVVLDKPIRQGQQRYQILVLQTTEEEQKQHKSEKQEHEIRVNLDQATLDKEYQGLRPLMRGSLGNLIAKCFRIVANKKVFVPSTFENAYKDRCVKCALRANEGHLYPLGKCFVFIHKPPVYIRFTEVESVEFQRYAGGQGSTRNFDLCVKIARSAGEIAPQKDYIFSGIDRSDHTSLSNFLEQKKIKILNPKGPEGTLMGAAAVGVQNEQAAVLDEMDDDSSTDDDFGSQDGESSTDDDADEDLEADDDADSDLEEARKNEAKKRKLAEARQANSAAAAQDKPKKKDKSSFSKSPSTPSSSKPSSKPSSSKPSSKPRPKPETTNSPKKSKTTPPKPNSKPTKKSSSKKKDPNAPKKPMTSFMYYSKEHRARIQSENPEAKFGDVAKLVGAAFKSLSDQDKDKYVRLAGKDRERYNDEMKNYTPPSDDSDSDDSDTGASKKRKSAAAKKKKKDPNAPKKNLSSFMYFNKEVRAKLKAENPNLTFGQLGSLVGKEFKALSSEQKEKYDKMARNDKIRYGNDMKNYTPPDESDESEEDRRHAKKKKVAATKKSKEVAKKKASKAESSGSESDSDSSDASSAESSDDSSGDSDSDSESDSDSSSDSD